MSEEAREGVKHLPVMVDEVVFFLRPERGGWFVDATVGLGGHAEAILGHSSSVRLLGIDRDPDTLAHARSRLLQFGDRVRLVHGDFRRLRSICEETRVIAPQGILFDLGVSSYQLRDSGRGFSFEREEPLDMRMDPQRGRSAVELVNTLPEEQLARLIVEYGEEPRAKRIARAIVNRRQRKQLQTTTDLVEIVRSSVPRKAWPKRLHVATRTFQALRIAVNDELSALTEALPQAAELLGPGGRLAVISFHSLEDRIVKRAIRDLADRGEWEGLEPAPVTPSVDEVRRNPRARSAKLRMVERTDAAA